LRIALGFAKFIFFLYICTIYLCLDFFPKILFAVKLIICRAMKLYILCFCLVLFFSTSVFAQDEHSLILNASASPQSTIIGSATGGTYTLPNGSGTLVTDASLATVAWVLGGNSSPSSNIFGTLTADDIVMQTNGVEQMRLYNTGGITIPNSTAAGVGVLYQNGGLLFHTLGTNNLFLGNNAGNLTIVGIQNTGIGYFALQSIANGSNNTALGSRALTTNTDGSRNTAVGTDALSNSSIGDYNTAIGERALYSNTTSSFNTALGRSALENNTVDGNTAVGYSALFSNTSGLNNTAVGNSALVNNTTASNNTAVGNGALNINTNSDNTAVGNVALGSNSVGGLNTATGSYALADNTVGSFNTANGASSLRFNTTGNVNTATGASALLSNNGGFNTADGGSALSSNTTGGFNSAMGALSLTSNTTGNNNIAAGESALLNNVSGSNCVAVGQFSGSSNTTEDNNTFIGYNANGAIGITNATAIGANAVVSQSNSLILGNGANVGIGESAPPELLSVGAGGLVRITSTGFMIVNNGSTTNGARIRVAGSAGEDGLIATASVAGQSGVIAVNTAGRTALQVGAAVGAGDNGYQVYASKLVISAPGVTNPANGYSIYEYTAAPGGAVNLPGAGVSGKVVFVINNTGGALGGNVEGRAIANGTMRQYISNGTSWFSNP
jgi:hypothetical protein